MVSREQVAEALKGVMDPHTGISVWEMGLIHDMEFDGGTVSLTFIPTSPFCPQGIQLAVAIKNALKALGGMGSVNVSIEGHVNAAGINEMLAKND